MLYDVSRLLQTMRFYYKREDTVVAVFFKQKTAYFFFYQAEGGMRYLVGWRGRVDE